MKAMELISKWQEEIQTITGVVRNKTELDRQFRVLCYVIAAELKAGGEVALPGVGKLKVTRLPARQGRNPRTGEPLAIPSRKKAVLAMSKELKDMMNR